jgi:hypothetical protein
MHCELLVPGLLPTDGPVRAAFGAVRLPALELLFARGRLSYAEPRSPERWLAEGFGLGDEPLAAGALTLLAHGGAPGEAHWARADPVHLRVGHDRVLLVPGDALSVSREEADALCEALNRHFGEALELQATHPVRWCARVAQDIELPAQPALEAAGREVAAPGGTKRAQALVNEVQMLLHAHPVNEAREARGEPAVNSLWLWGAGRPAKSARTRWQAVAADDPIALGLARLAGARHQALARDAQMWLERAPEDGRHLLVLDALRAPLALGDADAYVARLSELEARWFAPLLAELRATRVGMLTIHVPDGCAASFETVRGDLRRFWRRPRAIERYA